MLTEESIGKSIPQDWAADTGGSPSMTDQLYLFRERDLVSKVQIQVGGGMIYSRM